MAEQVFASPSCVHPAPREPRGFAQVRIAGLRNWDSDRERWVMEGEGDGEGDSVLVQKPGTWGQGCATNLRRHGAMLSSSLGLSFPR